MPDATASSSTQPTAFPEILDALNSISIAPGTTLRQVLSQVSALAAKALGVQRVSVWRLVADGSVLVCEYLHQEGQQGVYEGCILRAKDFPGYFKALENQDVIPVDDVQGATFMQEFHDLYLKPLGITSMLDAPILSGGEVCGVVCHENVGEPRRWSRQDTEFAAKIASTISRLYRQCVEQKWNRPLSHLQERSEALERMATFGRLAAGMAHDFKNILGVISGYVEMMLQAPPGGGAMNPDRVSAYAREALSAVEKGEAITHELMDLGHEDSHRPTVLDLRRFLEEIRGLIAMALKRDMELKFEIDSPVSRIFMDKRHLERILINLVLNAGEAMPSGGVIRIRLSETQRKQIDDEGDRLVALEVVDQGIGMSKEVQQRLFEPFFTTKGKDGTGLGMAIVRQMVSLASGKVEVESEMGRGSTIRLLFPRIAQPV